MTIQIFRLASLFAAAVALVAGDGAWAQVTVTDGVTSKTACTGYGLSASGGSTTITLTPSNCLTAASSGTDPVFSVRLASSVTTQTPTGTVGVQSVQVFVDADKDVTAEYTLTLNLCISTQNCTSANSANWYFFRYSQLGGAGFTRMDAVTSGSYTFTFQPGANTAPANMRSMGVGRMDVLNTPLFAGSANVMFSLSGAKAATTVVTHTIMGGLQTPGVDLDFYGNQIPNTPLVTPPPTTTQCEFPGYSGFPGPNSDNPCGAYRIPVDTCSTNMIGANAITNAYLLHLENHPGGRVGNTLRMGFPANTAMVFKFKTGAAGSFALPLPWGVAGGEQSNRGANRPIFMAVSEKKCDFNYDKVYVSGGTTVGKSGCFMVGLNATVTGSITASGTDPLSWTACQLKPDTYYYANLRWENASVPSQRGVTSCEPPNNTCGLALRFQ